MASSRVGVRTRHRVPESPCKRSSVGRAKEAVFPRARLGAADDVPTLARDGNRLPLDGSGRAEFQTLNSSEQFRPEAEFPETLGRLFDLEIAHAEFGGVFLVGDAVIGGVGGFLGFLRRSLRPGCRGFFLAASFFSVVIRRLVAACLFFRFYARSVLLMQRFSIILFSPRASAPAARIHGIRCRRVGFFLPGFAVGGLGSRIGVAPLGMGCGWRGSGFLNLGGRLTLGGVCFDFGAYDAR